MTNTTRFCVLLPLLLALTVLPGCNTKEAVTFNDNIVKSQERLAVSVDAWSKAIEKGNMAEAPRAHKNATDTLAAINAEAQTWKVPSTAAAKNLLDSHHRLMKIEGEAINNFGKVIDIMEDKTLSKEQMGSKIIALSGDIEARENAANAEMMRLQQVFAKEHNIKLLPPKK